MKTRITKMLIINVLCLAVLLPSALAQPENPTSSISEAPLNPEFIAWQQKVKNGELEISSDPLVTGHIPSPFDRSHLRFKKGISALALEEIPRSFDLRSSGYVSPVKDQGNCGACWTFGTYGALEGWLLKNVGELWDFSENHLKNCHSFDFSPCNGGGNEDMSIAYLTRGSGPMAESDDPYCDHCDFCLGNVFPQKYVTKVLSFTTRSDIKLALMSYGALHTWMRWDWNCYNSLDQTYCYEGNESFNHDVTLVGWDDNKRVPGALANGAWIAKNSWGTDFGDEGYFYISCYDTMAAKEAVAYCDAVPPSTYATIYYYDQLGLTGSGVGYGTTTAWGANIFTAIADEYLAVVGFYALAHNTSYEIKVYDRFNEGRFYDLLGSASGTVSYSGYYTITLSSSIRLRRGDDFAIVVKFTTPGHNGPIPIEKPIEGYSSRATANAGESYVSRYGQVFTDITTQTSYENANVCIKGLTTLRP